MSWTASNKSKVLGRVGPVEGAESTNGSLASSMNVNKTGQNESLEQPAEQSHDRRQSLKQPVDSASESPGAPVLSLSGDSKSKRTDSEVAKHAADGENSGDGSMPKLAGEQQEDRRSPAPKAKKMSRNVRGRTANPRESSGKKSITSTALGDKKCNPQSGEKPGVTQDKHRESRKRSSNAIRETEFAFLPGPGVPSSNTEQGVPPNPKKGTNPESEGTSFPGFQQVPQQLQPVHHQPHRSGRRRAKIKKSSSDEDALSLNGILTTPEGQIALHPDMTENQAGLAAKREYNRRNAARARKRSKNLMDDLQRTAYELARETATLRDENYRLHEQLKVLDEMNRQLVLNQEILNRTVEAPSETLIHQQKQQLQQQPAQQSDNSLSQLLSLLVAGTVQEQQQQQLLLLLQQQEQQAAAAPAQQLESLLSSLVQSNPSNPQLNTDNIILSALLANALQGNDNTQRRDI